MVTKIVRRISTTRPDIDHGGSALPSPERDSDVLLTEHRGLHRVQQQPRPAYEIVDRARMLSPRRWMETAVATMLAELEFFSVDAAARAGEDNGEQGEGAKPVAWAEDISVGKVVSPDHHSPAAAAVADGSVSYDGDVPILLEETRGVYGPHTVLRRLDTASVVVFARAMCGEPELAAGIEAAMAAEWAAEPGEELAGRRIVLPAYYDRPFRVRLVQTDILDNGDGQTRANRWQTVAQLAVSCEHVVLVGDPGRMTPEIRTAVT